MKLLVLAFDCNSVTDVDGFLSQLEQSLVVPADSSFLIPPQPLVTSQASHLFLTWTWFHDSEKVISEPGNCIS